MKTKKILALLLALTLMTALAACGTAPKQAPADAATSGIDPIVGDTAVTKDTLTFSGKDITSFNIYKTTSNIDLYINGMVIGEGLVLLNNNFEYEPLLAESFTVSDDKTVYTFNIKPGVTFHNGQPLTADDVVYSINAQMASASGSEFASYIDKVEKTDDMTVVITLKAPAANFLFLLYAYGAVVPNGVFESGYDWEAHPVGTGAYEFVSYVPGDKLVLKAYEGYHQPGYPKVKNVVYKTIADAATQVVALEAGQIDFLLADPTTYTLLENAKDIDVLTYPSVYTMMLWMDQTKAPFDDINVRMALNHAVDRDALSKVIGSKGYTPANQFSSPTVNGHSDVTGYAYDVELAKDLISKSKYGADQLKFTLTTREPERTAASFLQESFRKIGVEMEINIVDTGTFGAGLTTREFMAGLSAFGLGIDASANSYIYRSDAPYNMSNINIPEIDKLYDESSAMLNDADRFAAYKQIDQLVQDNAGLMSLVWKNNILGYNKSLAVDDAYFYACGDISLDLKSFYFK